jgi:ABC-2 type transport system ATP-binding protein
VGLADAAGQLVGDLSGGQRGRVSLACALVGEPDLLVLDEPTVGLDPVLRVELWDRFHSLAAAGTTLIVSSHVMDEPPAATGCCCSARAGCWPTSPRASCAPTPVRPTSRRPFLTLVRRGTEVAA